MKRMKWFVCLLLAVVMLAGESMPLLVQAASTLTALSSSSGVTTTLYRTGDINGDGAVNNKDLTRLTRYQAGQDVVVNEIALDTNGDGVYNVKDLARLQRYLAGTAELAVIEIPVETETETETESVPETETETETESETEAMPDPGVPSDYEGVVISKVFATGNKADAAMSHSFVELYNTTTQDISLAGSGLYYRADNTSEYQTFAFGADAVIPAGGYYLVRGDEALNYDTSYEIMRLTAWDAEWDIDFDNKEVRLMFGPSGMTLPSDSDVLTYGAGVSAFWGSMTDRESAFAVYDISKSKIAVRTALTTYSGYHKVNLTKAASAELKQNCPKYSGGEAGYLIGSALNEVKFSHDAGIYESGFDLILRAAAGYTVYYTTDGSDPRVKGKEYTGRFRLNDTTSMSWGPVINAWNGYSSLGIPTSSKLPGAHVIKAYATDGTNDTEVFTNTYFIGSTWANYDVPVVSVSLPKDDMMGSKGFYSNYNPTGNLTAERPRALAMMEVFDPDGARVGYSNVELAVAGNGSTAFSMKSMRVYYKSANNPDGGGTQSDLDYDLFQGLAVDDNGEAITSFSRLFLRNSGNDCCSSYMRDAFIQRVSKDLNADTMASRPVLVFINGEFWGMYNARERYSPEYVEDHYGVNKDVVTWIENDYSQVHTNHNAPVVVASGVTSGASDFNALVDYIKSHNMANSTYYKYVCDRLDIESLIDVYAVRLFFNSIDWPENNLKAWKNTDPNDPSGMDTKWHFVLLDTDMGASFYSDLTREDLHIYDRAFNYGSVTSNIMMGLMNNPTFKKQFLTRYYELITEIFTPAYLESQLDIMAAERRPLMTLQGQRWGNEGSAGLSKFNSQVDVIRKFVRNRHSHALNMLFSYFNTSAEELESSNPRIMVSFDATKTDVVVNGKTVASGTKFELTGAGQTFNVQATAKAGYEVKAIVFIDSGGQMTRVESATATFNPSGGGTIEVSVMPIGGTQTELPVDAGLTAGGDYLFYLKENGDLYAWGSNANGGLGLGTSPAIVTKPTLVMQNVAKVATCESGNLEQANTAWATAILTRDGCVYTVGNNSAGQLGRNGTTSSAVLGQINFTGRIVDVAMGFDHLLVLDESGVLWGIGSNTYGQLGASGNGSNVSSFQRVASGVKTVVAGRRNTMFLDQNDDLYGMGDNRYNKINRTSTVAITTPYKMMSGVAYIDAGEHEMLAVAKDGILYYAGWRDINSFTQGPGNNPVMAKVMTGVVKADIFFGDIAILTTTGAAHVYGINNGNATSHVATYGSTYKVLGSNVVDVAAGYAFTAYLLSDGRLVVQGNNTNGIAGNGKTGGTVDMIAINLP